MAKIFNPVSTYRFQFHKDFTFKDAERLIPYLVKLGVGSVYASPIFQAVQGSMHGYDVTNPLVINPEIGSLKDLRQLTGKLQKDKIMWVQDIVPNHMAFHPENSWLMEVMENGPEAEYAKVFDTSFGGRFFNGPVMVPFLGEPLVEAIANGTLKLALRNNKLALQYFDQVYPVNILGYAHLLQRELNKEQFKKERLLQDLNELTILHGEVFRARAQSFFNRWKEALSEVNFLHAIQRLIAQINESAKDLLMLCNQQYYRLCDWKESDEHINFRRFFTVNSLICLQVQDDEVFNLTHGFIKQLIAEGVFQGLRIDHIDGLFDPEKYLHDLRRFVGREAYIVAEKILEKSETIPLNWPLQGTSGYDYLAISNKLFTNQENEKSFDSFYQKLIGRTRNISQQIVDKKTFFLDRYMRGEQHNLLQLLKALKLVSRLEWEEVGEDNIREAIANILIYCPVYRFYGNKFPLNPSEQMALKAVFNEIRIKTSGNNPAINLLAHLFLDQANKVANSFNSKLCYFYQRLMQFSGPLMAKGVEDTLMYTYNRFVVHNEVGDAPDAFGMDVEAFHKTMKQRQGSWALSMSSTATHDTKRGEDTRSRLHALSSLPRWWKDTIVKLETVIEAKQDQELLPEINDRYLIYQTVIASYPARDKERQKYGKRIASYLQKALREAKERSDWASPNEPYEKKCINFALLLIDKEEFWSIWYPLWEYVNDQGMLSSLAQTALKLTAPGVPDVYQGTEDWDFSLVDPDNRRPVDYPARQKLLKGLDSEHSNLLELWRLRQNGLVKLFVTKQLLQYRRTHAELFEKGIYLPLRVRGRYRKYLLAFGRRYENKWSITIIPMHLAALCQEQNCLPENINWKNTRIDWPKSWPKSFFEIFSQIGGVIKDDLQLQELFRDRLPMVILQLAHKEKKRKAGVLMPISSLHSFFGIGDLGPQAYVFANQLAKAGQSYWQILPMNPSGPKEYYSPYSAFSAFAGNPLLISLERLSEEGLLTSQELNSAVMRNDGKVDYEAVEQLKQKLLQKAYGRFSADKLSVMYQEFLLFLKEEAWWLDDFAIYLAIKKDQQGKPWYEWPQHLRLRQRRSVDSIANKYQAYILLTKWQQYVFFKQWFALQAHCHTMSIQLFGDLPIYVNYDGVDVWANRELFHLDKDGKMLGVAGVPPDYFNANGQLWGMPVFDWSAHRKQDFAWWVRRIRKNLELYDLLRLDHFRAFYDYWDVPASEETAINGEWKDGPGEQFFHILIQTFGELPFVAEDLGDMNEGVYKLRDQFKLPGMKVLQFAFGKDLPHSIHIPHQYPHNSVVYTGTHDNNTVKGWYMEELNKADRDRLQQYLGRKVSKSTVSKEFIRLAYASVSKLAIVPMQDILALAEEARMNTPATIENNWSWRIRPKQLSSQHLTWLNRLTRYYGR